jgi:hypothetical protein
MAEVYSWMTSQANATAKTTPRTGNPTRNARSSRRTGSWMRKNFGRGRLSTTAVSATKSSSFTSRPNSPRHSPNSRRRAPSQCRGSSASGPRRPVARPRRTRRIRVGLQHAPRSTRAVLGIKPCLNVAGVGRPSRLARPVLVRASACNGRRQSFRRSSRSSGRRSPRTRCACFPPDTGRSFRRLP